MQQTFKKMLSATVSIILDIVHCIGLLISKNQVSYPDKNFILIMALRSKNNDFHANTTIILHHYLAVSGLRIASRGG